jgi:hypothetical protein
MSGHFSTAISERICAIVPSVRVPIVRYCAYRNLFKGSPNTSARSCRIFVELRERTDLGSSERSLDRDGREREGTLGAFDEQYSADLERFEGYDRVIFRLAREVDQVLVPPSASRIGQILDLDTATIGRGEIVPFLHSRWSHGAAELIADESLCKLRERIATGAVTSDTSEERTARLGVFAIRGVVEGKLSHLLSRPAAGSR